MVTIAESEVVDHVLGWHARGPENLRNQVYSGTWTPGIRLSAQPGVSCKCTRPHGIIKSKSSSDAFHQELMTLLKMMDDLSQDQHSGGCAFQAVYVLLVIGT